MSLAPWIEKERLEAGCDEAGRGCLAGPVTAASVILSPNLALELVNDGVLDDSKKLNKKVRDALREKIESEALAWAVCHISPQEIDRINILQASLLAMKRAVEDLELVPDKVLCDGNRCPSLPLPVTAIVRGDATEPCISAASIVAKVTRDRIMVELHARYPHYGFSSHKGYPTKSHQAALQKYGPIAEHRRSFGPVRRYLQGED